MSQFNADTRATFGGGCFWCLEAVFQDVKGVQDVVSGYAGGSTKDPTYDEVCSGTTGHAEIVDITFDPSVITYEELLQIFFAVHDPTTLNRQGDDVGTQYRSIVFFHTKEQQEAAERVILELEESGIWEDPIVTQLRPAGTVYPAESYHHRYFARNAQQPYCQWVVAPKVAKFRQQFADKLRR